MQTMMKKLCSFLTPTAFMMAAFSLGAVPSFPAAAASDGSAQPQYDDAGITARIKTTYIFNTHLSAYRINVDTDNGVVTLQGVVRSEIEKELAVSIAKSARGVKSVRDNLKIAGASGAIEAPDEVERTFSQAVIDATTTANVKTALALAKGVKAGGISVTTRWGTVTLNGIVSTKAERELAEKTTRELVGVKEVVNKIIVQG
jgi:hyperosmotically inducible protein